MDFKLKFTDVDYGVFNDAARYWYFIPMTLLTVDLCRLMWNRESPYLRYAYRYPPAFAIMLMPNCYLSAPDIGKVTVYLSTSAHKSDSTYALGDFLDL